MKIPKAVNRVVTWINQAENQAVQHDQQEGSYADGGTVSYLSWMKNTLLAAPTEELQSELLNHWTRTGLLPGNLLDTDDKGEQLKEE